MMVAMPRPRPPHLQRETTRHGRTVWYVRIGKAKRVRIGAEFGTAEFDAEYRAALSGNPRPDKAGPTAGTLEWLITRYRETTAWMALSAATRRQRENILKHVIKSAGRDPYKGITSGIVAAGRDRRAATPAQARNFLDAMRGLFKWALEAKHVKLDPTTGIKNPPRKAGAGFIAWTEENVFAYQKRWPIGTRQRVWLDLLLFTGLRRGDAVRIGRQHVRDGVASIKTEKSGETIELTLPILPVLAKTLKAGPCGELTFIAGENGRPLTKESFGNVFREACRAAGVPGSAHGVRKIAATTAAMNGATTEQLKAIFGWTSDGMASLYVKSANRRRLAIEAMHKLATSIPAPDDKVRASGEKDQ
jgi:integrase